MVSTISGNDARIIQVNQHIVDFSAKQSSNMLIIKNNDEPGAIGEIGSMLGKLGININSVPVLDLRRSITHNIIGDRSYSSNKKLVTKIGPPLFFSKVE